MDLEVYQVDSFASEPFKDNPAGVCITQQALDESLLFAIATEMAVSETALLFLRDLRLRWFTPKVEVSLCGHGTLAVAHILKEKGLVAVGEEVVFNTLSGLLVVKVKDKHIEMDFPATIIDFNLSPDDEMLAHLGISFEQVVSFGVFDSKHFIEISNDRQLLNLNPNFDGLKKLQGRGIVVTAMSVSQNIDFISRYFAPWVGINEDPVTGSAHCALAVYWGQKLNQSVMRGYQASARGGFVSVELLSSGRVKLMGDAVTVLKGTLHL